MNRFIFGILVVVFLSSCNKEEVVKRNTLSDFVVENEEISKNKKIRVSSEKARRSYRSYLSSAGKKSKNRKKALQRLAEIQLDIAVSSPVNSKNGYDKNSINIFKKRLREYPKDKNNDRVYYQLANAYAITGDENGKISTLETLTDVYPESKYYLESMFRLGESYIRKSEFIDAELALTSVIAEDSSNKFKKNALFKRAWSRYKQLQYETAIDDYNQLLVYYPEGKSDNRADQEFLNNIYKVYGVCISYLGIKDTLGELKEALKNKNTRYYIYTKLAELLVKQDRYIDAASVYDIYLSNESSEHVSEVVLALSDIWLKYDNRVYAMDKLIALEETSGKLKNNKLLNSSSLSKLSSNLIKVSQYYHSLYQKTKGADRKDNLSKALNSYVRLIKNYKSDKIEKYHFLYAELLNDSKAYKESISQYEEIIRAYKNKEYTNKSAYSLLILSNNLYNKKLMSQADFIRLNSKYLNHVDVTNVYKPLLSYAEFLYNNKNYKETAAILEEIKVPVNINISKKMFLLASSYFSIQEYSMSEKVYHSLKKIKHNYKDIDKRLALAIFKQADGFKDKLLFEQAIKKYHEIETLGLDSNTILLSKIELSGLLMRTGKWSLAEEHLTSVRKKFAINKFSNDVTRMLSIVYLNSNKSSLAAIEFERINKLDGAASLKRSALWQSAELFEKGGDFESSIRVFKTYAQKYKTPVALNIEAQNKLTSLYSKVGNLKNRKYWLKQIITTTDRLGKNSTDRMRFLASKASMDLARSDFKLFSSVKLTVPLKVSLKKKKKVLQRTIASLQKVNKYKMYEHVSESIYWLAETYYDFSENLMKSERPKNLSELELEQYDVLLEDQAIPFEDQAIRYFIQNAKQSSSGSYSDWMNKSFKKLSLIYPSKYKRVERVDSQVNQFY